MPTPKLSKAQLEWCDEFGQPLSEETIRDLRDFERDLMFPRRLERENKRALSQWIAGREALKANK